MPVKTPKDAQSKYEVAREYKAHLDSVGADRQLEEFLQAPTRFHSVRDILLSIVRYFQSKTMGAPICSRLKTHWRMMEHHSLFTGKLGSIPFSAADRLFPLFPFDIMHYYLRMGWTNQSGRCPETDWSSPLKRL